MKKSVIFLCVVVMYASGCASIKTAVNNYTTPQDVKVKNYKKEQINNAYNEEIKNIHKYGDFVLDINLSFSSYDEVSSSLFDVLIDGVKRSWVDMQSIEITKPAKYDTGWNVLVCNELETLEIALKEVKSNILNSLKVNYIPKGYSEYQENIKNIKITERDCRENENFLLLESKIAKVGKLKNEIYDFSYNFEREKFIKAYGVDIEKSVPLVSILMNYMAEKPTSYTIYDLSHVKVLQSTREGILISAMDMYRGEIYPDKVAFIYTKQKFVDGEVLEGKLARYVGTYDYKNILKVNKTVYAFKFFTLKSNEYKINKDEFFFYPALNQPTAEYIKKFFKTKK